ncbi:MAG: DNA-binding protein WhiA [Peptostreptococcales bacterium]
MSFSSETKNELSQIIPDSNCCKLAELSGFIRMSGNISFLENGIISVEILTENAAVARKMIKLVRRLFDIQIKLTINRNRTYRKGYYYQISASLDEQAEKILKKLEIIMEDDQGTHRINSSVPRKLIYKRCCKRAYLRGVFLGSGSISDPNKSYHLEIVTAQSEIGEEIKQIINSFGLNAKMIARKNNYIVYLKEGDQIIDFLSIIGAHNTLLDAENIRIVKDVRNQVNRLVNCDTANLNKIVDTAGRQIESIKYIEKTKGLKILPDKLREIAELRLENMESSLKELGEMMDPALGKSGVNHRMKRIEEIAQKIKKGEVI